MNLIEDIRRARLDLLINEFGSVAALAQRLDRQPAQVSQWRNASIDTKSGKPRYMKSETARRIESLTGKPDGWMDQPIPKSNAVNEDREIYSLGEVHKLTYEERLLLDWFRSKTLIERKAVFDLLKIPDTIDFVKSA